VPECEAAVRSFAANDLTVVRDEAPALIRGSAVLNEPVREERSGGNPSSRQAVASAPTLCHR
jgi:hypothetical protein